MHGGTLVATGTCLANASAASIGDTDVKIAATSQTTITIANLPDDVPVGATTLVVVAGAVRSLPTSLVVIHLTIDEVDGDTPPGNSPNDFDQFIEVNIGLESVRSLAGYQIVLIDGTADQTYLAMQAMPLGTTRANGRFVLGNSGVGPDYEFPTNFLARNANAHAVTIIQTKQSVGAGIALGSIPGIVIDAVVFSREDAAADAALLTFAYPEVADRVQHSETFGGVTARDVSVRRCATTRRRTGLSFSIGMPITPGTPNGC